jgi:pSer/pThr/pTyr-binding forkhead associated (FHA) protein
MNNKTDIDATVVNQRMTPTFYLRGLAGDVADKIIPLSSNTKFGNTSVGRDQDCHIVINNPGVSRRHAAFHVEEGAVWLQDLDSANGTFVNQVSISGKQALYPGDVVAFDKVQFKLEAIGDVLKPTGTPVARTPRPAAPAPSAEAQPANSRSWGRVILIVALLAVAALIGYSVRDLF